MTHLCISHLTQEKHLLIILPILHKIAQNEWIILQFIYLFKRKISNLQYNNKLIKQYYVIMCTFIQLYYCLNS